MEEESAKTRPIPKTKLGHQTEQNYNRSNYKMFYKSVIIHKNGIFPYSENKVKKLSNMIIMMMMIIIIIIIMIIRKIIIKKMNKKKKDIYCSLSFNLFHLVG